MELIEHHPGEPASRAGHYEELAVMGSPTGKVVHRELGQPLPAAPRGFTWRHVPVAEC